MGPFGGPLDTNKSVSETLNDLKLACAWSDRGVLAGLPHLIAGAGIVAAAIPMLAAVTVFWGSANLVAFGVVVVGLIGALATITAISRSAQPSRSVGNS
jgi:hypothetical protein